MRIAAALPSLETGSPHRRSIDAMLEGLLAAGIEMEGFAEHDRLDQGDGFPVYHYLRMPERHRAAGFDLALYPIGRDAGPYQGVFALMNLYPGVAWIQDPSVHHLALGGIALLDNWTDYRAMLDAAYGRRGAAIAQTVASHWGTGALFRRYDLMAAVAGSQPGVLVAWPSLGERVASRLRRPVGLAPLGVINPPTVTKWPAGEPAAGSLPPVAVMTVNESYAKTAVEAAGAVLEVSPETTVTLCLSEPIYRAAGLPAAQHLGIDDRIRFELTTSPRRLSEVASSLPRAVVEDGLPRVPAMLRQQTPWFLRVPLAVNEATSGPPGCPSATCRADGTCIPAPRVRAGTCAAARGAPAGPGWPSRSARTPWCWGYRPVRSDARVGEQNGTGQVAWVNRTPSAARRSRFGVFTVGWPAQPSTRWWCWSVIRKSRLRGFSSAAREGRTASAAPDRTRKLRRVSSGMGRAPSVPVM